MLPQYMSSTNSVLGGA